MEPLLVLVIAIAGLVLGRAAAEGERVGQIGNLVGQAGAQAIQDNWQVRRKRMVDIFHEGGWEYRCEPLALPDPVAAERTLNQLGSGMGAGRSGAR